MISYSLALLKQRFLIAIPTIAGGVLAVIGAFYPADLSARHILAFILAEVLADTLIF